MRQVFLKQLLLTLAVFLVVGLVANAAPPNVGTDGLPLLAEDRPNAPWITTWYGLDAPITNNGGHGVGSDRHWVEEGTDGRLTDESLSTMQGLRLTKNLEVELPNNGGTFGWSISTIAPADGNNMATRYGLPGATDNIDTYQIIVIKTPRKLDAVMGSAHDDHAQIWLNGTKIYGNFEWTGAATRVSYDVETTLDSGFNVLLYRCSEGGGSAYANLHFDDDTTEAANIYPENNDIDQFWRDIENFFPVEPADKLATLWGDVKQP